MKNIRILFSALVVMLAGLVSCSDELAQPPVTLPEGGIGTGVWNNPMTVTQVVLGTTNPNLDQCWVTGYIVGWVDSSLGTVLNARTARFTVPAGLSSNLLLAADPGETDWQKCATVKLISGAARTALNLQDNPGNLGRQVTLRGSLGSNYFGVSGIRDVSMYNWGDEGTEGHDVAPVPDPTPGETIFKSLAETEKEIPEGWTVVNVKMPSGTRDIWSWKEYNSQGYLNAQGTGECESYCISPAVDLGNYRRATLSFMHAAKFQTTLRELCGVVVREAGTAEWTQLDIPVWPSAGAWTFVSSGGMDLTPWAGKRIEIGFRYGSSSKGADTWEIRNMLVSGVRK